MEDVEQMTKVMYPDAVRFWIENRGIPAQLVQGRPPDLIVVRHTLRHSRIITCVGTASIRSRSDQA